MSELIAKYAAVIHGKTDNILDFGCLLQTLFLRGVRWERYKYFLEVHIDSFFFLFLSVNIIIITTSLYEMGLQRVIRLVLVVCCFDGYHYSNHDSLKCIS